MTTTVNSRHWVLVKRPQGALQAADLERVERPVRAPGEDEVLIRVLYLAMDPAIRGFMNAGGNYAAPLPLGAPVRGMVLGQVLQSRSAALREGQIVWGFGSWSDYVVGPAAQFFAVSGAEASPAVAPASSPASVPAPSPASGPPHSPASPLAEFKFDLPAYTHVLGTIGLTAHYGLFDVGGLVPGDTVLVSAATGAVGSLVGQMARIQGAARVVGIAGGPAKCRLAVDRYGYDACIDYKAVPDLGAAIGEALPAGIDVHFENVGGAVLAAAVDHLAKNARIALCGMIASYNGDATARAADRPNLWNLVVKTARLQGFLVSDVLGQRERCAGRLAEIADWIRAGRLNYDLDVRDGFDTVPAVYNDLFAGAHSGRLVVRLADR